MLKDAGLSGVEDVLVGKLAWPCDPYLPQSKCSVTYYHGFSVGRKDKYSVGPNGGLVFDGHA